MKTLLLVAFAVGFGYMLGQKNLPEPVQCENTATEESQMPARVATTKKSSRSQQQTPPTPPGRIVTVNSTVIKKMEENLNNLPQQIELQRVVDGWKITKMKADSLFAQAGLQLGDLITDTAVEELSRVEKSAQDLPERFSRILKFVSR